MSIILTKKLHEMFWHSNRVYIEVTQCELSYVCWALLHLESKQDGCIGILS